jgi:hypothetical protein
MPSPDVEGRQSTRQVLPLFRRPHLRLSLLRWGSSAAEICVQACVVYFEKDAPAHFPGPESACVLVQARCPPPSQQRAPYKFENSEVATTKDHSQRQQTCKKPSFAPVHLLLARTTSPLKRALKVRCTSPTSPCSSRGTPDELQKGCICCQIPMIVFFVTRI